eukprot:233637-Pleurochrysis_carterae.AAC.1
MNTCSAAVAVTLANKVTIALKKRMNAVLRRYGQNWSFAETKGQRDTRPSGNESRALLTLRGLLRELLCIRYGEASNEDEEAPLDDLSSARERGARQIDAQPEPVAVGKKRKQRTEVTSTGRAKGRQPTPPSKPPSQSPLPPQPQPTQASTSLLIYRRRRPS